MKPTESPEKDVRNGSKSGTKDGPTNLTASAIKSGSNGVLNGPNNDGSVSNGGTGSKEGLNGSTKDADLTGDGASEVPKGSTVVDDFASVTTIISLTDPTAADTTPPQTSGGGPVDVVMTHQSYDDDLARILIEIGDAQHLVENSTGVALEIAKEDMLKLQYSFSKKRR